MPMEAIDDVVTRWKANHLSLNPPASAKDLARLEAELGCPLPEDVRTYFSLADGMADGEYEEETFVALWPIRKIVTENEGPDGAWRKSGKDALGEFRDLGFADFSIHASFICFRMRPSSGLAIHVEQADLELPSLESFFRRYLDDPGSLDLLDLRDL